MEFNIIDYLVFAIIILSIISGMQKGFIEAIGGIISVVAALILAAVFYHEAAAYLEGYYGTTSFLAEYIRLRFPLTAIAPEGRFFLGAVETKGVIDTAQYISNRVMDGACFLGIFIMVSLLLRLIWKGMDGLFSWGILSWINRIMGALLVSTKNLLLLALLIGLIFPLVDMGANIGLTGAVITHQYLQDSIMADVLLGTFKSITHLLGIGV